MAIWMLAATLVFELLVTVFMVLGLFFVGLVGWLLVGFVCFVVGNFFFNTEDRPKAIIKLEAFRVLPSHR